jgi:hypothetical protein
MARPPKPTRLKALATYKSLAARVRVILGTTKVQSSTVNALARVAALAAVGKRGAISASIKASLLITGVKTGKFFTLLNVADTFTATEIRNFNMSKLRVDEIQAVDRALAEVFKVLADAAHVADQVDRAVGKRLADTTLSSEFVTRDSSKVLGDTVPTGDLVAKGFSTTRQDVFDVSDDSSVEFGKRAIDGATANDLFDRTVAFVRFFEDVTDATDEINANLLTDDGQVVFLSKVLFDVVPTATQTTFDVARVQSDTTTTSDEALLAAAKQLDDAISVGDFNDIEFGASRADQVLTAESLEFDTARVSQDTAVSSSNTTRSFSKFLADTVTTTDSLSFFLDAYYATGVVTSEHVDVVRIAAGGVPPQNENQTAFDTTAVGVNKNFFDTVGVTDDIYGEATIDDEQTNFVGKNLTENLLTSELRTVALQRTLQESANVGSSGLLAMTNYCDSTYFSQAYVGTERIFS